MSLLGGITFLDSEHAWDGGIQFTFSIMQIWCLQESESKTQINI